MTDLRWSTVPPLRRPLLLMAFEGLFDAGGAATGSLRRLCERFEVDEIAEIEAEHFFDFSEQRPLVKLVDDGPGRSVRTIVWPSTTVSALRSPTGRDLVIVNGVEPHLRWRSFADHVVEIVRRTGAELAVTVGAMVAMVPHTRTFAVKGSAADPDLAARLSLDRPSYQGPTGVVGVINERLDRVGLPVMSIRVEVPHYVPAAPNPKAEQALLRRLEETTGITTGHADLDAAAAEWVTRVDAAVSADDDSRSYVDRLERQVDADPARLPSGDDLAAEFEAFLRGRSEGSGDTGADTGEPGSGSDDPGDDAPTSE